ARNPKGHQLTTRGEGGSLEVAVPTFRRDLGIEDDLVEEVIRVWGYDKIPSTLPGGAIRLVQLPATQRQAATVRRALVGAGVLEVMTYSFSDRAYEGALRITGTQRPDAVLNPRSRDASWLPDCHAALMTSTGVTAAEFGEIGADARRLWDISVPVFAALLPLDEILRLMPPPLRYQPLPRFPSVQRDLAFVVGALRAVTAAEIERAIREAAGPLLRSLTLFDVFTFDDGPRSLAWRLTFQADDRTLTDDEVNAIQERVARRIEERFNITWRGA